MQNSNETLIAVLKREGVLHDEYVLGALRAVDRRDFVPETLQDAAYENEALPIGFGQTISQPYTVVFMLELLGAKKGETVLDVGYGSGWQTALLAHIIGKKGRVFAAEIVPELCQFGKENVAKYPKLFTHVAFLCGDAAESETIRRDIIFDRIIVAADIDSIPDRWREMLRPGGVLVYPSHGVMKKEQKRIDGTYAIEEYPGFAFVPFV